MEPKKNQHVELKRNSLLYFFMGMFLVLLLIYTALEWKTYYETPDWDISLINSDVLPDEEIPITIQKLPPPPPPQIQAPPVIEIVEDDTDLEETVIESSETDQDTEIITYEDIEVVDEDIPEEVSFIVVEDAPIFPGCENVTDKEEKKICFQNMMQKHIQKNIRYPEIAQEMGLEGRVNVVFTIQKDGTIGDVRMRGPHESLEGEAARIISKLPRMTPGKQRGTAVKVPFSIPITFKLN
jgi:protein TonB